MRRTSGGDVYATRWKHVCQQLGVDAVKTDPATLKIPTGCGTSVTCAGMNAVNGRRMRRRRPLRPHQPITT
jgi:hypothetical protein